MLDRSYLAQKRAISAPGAVPRHTPAPNPTSCPEETGTGRGSQKFSGNTHMVQTDLYPQSWC
eukprot:6198438-Pleurochrysis_carterae.AAC.1